VWAARSGSRRSSRGQATVIVISGLSRGTLDLGVISAWAGGGVHLPKRRSAILVRAHLVSSKRLSLIAFHRRSSLCDLVGERGWRQARIAAFVLPARRRASRRRVRCSGRASKGVRLSLLIELCVPHAVEPLLRKRSRNACWFHFGTRIVFFFWGGGGGVSKAGSQHFELTLRGRRLNMRRILLAPYGMLQTTERPSFAVGSMPRRAVRSRLDRTKDSDSHRAVA